MSPSSTDPIRHLERVRVKEDRYEYAVPRVPWEQNGHDEANRAAVKLRAPDAMKLAGLALREDRKLVDKITKGARMHA